MADRIAIFGYGPVGRATTARLVAEGREVIVAQRNSPSDLLKGATFTPTDALDRDAVFKAANGSGQFVVTLGFPYSAFCGATFGRGLSAISSPPAKRPARAWCSWTIFICTARRQSR